MRLTAVTFGTEGDWRPMVALCRGLVAAGHDVLLLGPFEAAALAAAVDVPFEALAGDMAGELHAAMPVLSRSKVDASAASRVLTGFAVRHTGAWMRSVLRAAEGRDAIVFAGLAVYVGLSCAEHRRMPAIGVALQPIMPTREFASPFLPSWRLPGWANHVTHRLVLALVWRAFRAATNDARRDLTGQSPRRAEWTGYPIAFGMSPTLVPPPRDWPPRYEVTGDWSLRVDPAWRPEPALERFLQAGEPPVYAGFGSMLGFDEARAQQAIVAALAGRRAVIAGGPSRLGEGALPANVMRIGHTPHAWLFPRVRVVVHHGGAGTTHAAARAGVPSVVVPFAADQHFWADRARRLGMAPAPLPIKALDAAALRMRIELASGPGYAAATRRVADAMRGEDGVTRAMAFIERWIGSPG